MTDCGSSREHLRSEGGNYQEKRQDVRIKQWGSTRERELKAKCG